MSSLLTIATPQCAAERSDAWFRAIAAGVFDFMGDSDWVVRTADAGINGGGIDLSGMSHFGLKLLRRSGRYRPRTVVPIKD